MKLRTSFFNPTVLRKDITRYFPIWGIYSVICLLYLIGLATGYDSSYFAHDIYYLLPGMAMVNCIYGGICALFLFGDLFNTRLCNALHAMPLRREGWFLTHTVAGLLFSIVPNTLVACLSCIWLGAYSYMAFVWLAVTVLQYLFFFGVASFSAICAGNRLGMAAVYGIINLLSLIVYVIVDSLFIPMLYGIMLTETPFDLLCPVYHLMEQAYVNVVWDHNTYVLIWKGFEGAAWLYLGICAALGILFMVLALLLYRKRKLEYAADFLAFKPLSPVFLIIYTLGIAVLSYQLGREVSDGIGLLFLVVGFTVGFFTDRMFLERKVNVFHLKAWLSFGILAVVLAAAMGLTWLDPIGLTRKVPEPTEVASVRVFDYAYNHVSYRDDIALKLTEPEDLALITDVHQTLLEERKTDGGMTITLVYTLKDGTTLRRYYELDAESPVGQKLKPYFSRWEFVFSTDDWSSVTERVSTVIINDYLNERSLTIDIDTVELAQPEYHSYVLNITDGDRTPMLQLVEAIRKDCDAGNMAQNFDYIAYNDKDYGWIEVCLGPVDSVAIRYSADATNTHACIESLFAQAEKQAQ